MNNNIAEHGDDISRIDQKANSAVVDFLKMHKTKSVDDELFFFSFATKLMGIKFHQAIKQRPDASDVRKLLYVTLIGMLSHELSYYESMLEKKGICACVICTELKSFHEEVDKILG